MFLDSASVRAGESEGRIPCVLAAALFAVHPLHVEPVAWVASKKDVLSGCFWMLTLLAYLRYTRLSSLGSYLAVLLSCALGLMAKSVLISLPIVLLLLDIWPLKRLKERLRWCLLEKIPLIVLAGCFVGLTYSGQQALGTDIDVGFLRPITRLGNAWFFLLHYLHGFLWPLELSVHYAHPLDGLGAATVLSSAAAILVISVSTIALLHRYPFLLVGWFWWLVVVLPYLQVTQIGNQAVADRWMYLPLAGLAVMLSWSILVASRRLMTRGYMAPLFVGVLTAGVAVLAHRQASYWATPGSILQRAIEVEPYNHRAWGTPWGEAIKAQKSLRGHGRRIGKLLSSTAISPPHSNGLHNYCAAN